MLLHKAINTVEAQILGKKKKGKEVAESHFLNGGLQRGSPQYNPKLLGSQQKACPARQVNMYREVQWYFTGSSFVH